VSLRQQCLEAYMLGCAFIPCNNYTNWLGTRNERSTSVRSGCFDTGCLDDLAQLNVHCEEASVCFIYCFF